MDWTMVKQVGGYSRRKTPKVGCRLALAYLPWVLFWLLAVPAPAAVTGRCSDCHTMHNSQDHASLAFDASGATTDLPNSKLLIHASCLGCHTGQNGDGKHIPYVLTTGGVHYGGATADQGTGTESGANTLAGGNFYWVGMNDAVGHNVNGLANDVDDLLAEPPGFNTGFSANGAVAATWSPGQLTCAGTSGCHGRHHDGDSPIIDPFQAIEGGHHGDDSTIDGSSVSKSYRFLYGIIGFEDSDWEFRPTVSTHNQYHGVSRVTTGAPPADSSTISYLCAECHGNFHAGTGALHASSGVGSPWLRHPIDFDLSDASRSEYAAYGGATNTYQLVTPVASDLGASVDNTGTTLDLETVLTTGSGAIVTCISCHRAHGTPHYKSMRWDYAGSTGSYCSNCHTSKN